MIVQEPVQATIWFTLNHYAYTDAIFLAERLHAEVGSEEALYLLATCYYRAGKQVSAYSILSNKGCKSSDSRLLLARCCVDLKKYSEAEEALLGSCLQTEAKFCSKSILSADELVAEFGDSASFAAQLLALICTKTERQTKANEYYKRSLKLNPFLWSSFESLVQLGVKADSTKIFNVSNVDFNLCHGCNPLISLWNSSTGGSSGRSSESGFTSHQTQPVTIKEQNLNQPIPGNFEINSPFAVIKSAPEPGTIDVLTPDNNSWVTTACYAPQKQVPGGKVVKKSCLNPAIDNLSPALVTRSDTPTGSRLSFGVFPLGDTLPVNGLPNSTPDNIDAKPQPVDNSSKITRAPIKKPQTRRSQQQQSQGLGSTSTNFTRSNAPKLQIFTQSANFNTQGTDSGLSSLQTSNTSTTAANQTGSQQPSLALRRSSRLFNSSSSVKENSKGTSRSTNQENNKSATSSKTPTKKTRRQSNSTSITGSSSSVQQKESELNEINKPETLWPSAGSGVLSEELVEAGLKMQKASAEGLLNLLSELGKASMHLGQFQCQKAIEVLQSLPLKHFNTGWVLSALGKAYFELAKYEEAAKYFEDAHQCEPHRLQGTEYYSTALWHLQREVKLSMLAQELIEFDKNAPQTWCVAGNCFSLQKEHETAIKFLKRAIQVDSEFAYAYTLLGHELVLTEEMEHATACFRSAIRIDPRHYNAWYGIGMICYKQEKYQMAELHYRKALQISPCSPVLMCHLGVVQHSLKKTELALQTLDKAIERDPKSALCKFHRASIYFAMDKHPLALEELETLKQIVPKESLVYFLIGKVHKRIGNTHLALMNFSWAMDLDPKGANNQIKEVIDRQYANDDDEVVVCLDSSEETGAAGSSSGSQLATGNSSVSLRRRSQTHHGSTSSMEAEDDNDPDNDNEDEAHFERIPGDESI